MVSGLQELPNLYIGYPNIPLEIHRKTTLPPAALVSKTTMGSSRKFSGRCYWFRWYRLAVMGCEGHAPPKRNFPVPDFSGLNNWNSTCAAPFIARNPLTTTRKSNAETINTSVKRSRVIRGRTNHPQVSRWSRGTRRKRDSVNVVVIGRSASTIHYEVNTAFDFFNSSDGGKVSLSGHVNQPKQGNILYCVLYGQNTGYLGIWEVIYLFSIVNYVQYVFACELIQESKNLF